MADVKWIKITTDIFDDEKILLIESLPDAYAIITVWFKLLCLAGKQNNSGVFMMGKIAYTDTMLATIFRMKETTVQLALRTFEEFGMIEIIDGVITIPNWGKHQNLDQLESKKEYMRNYMKEYREKQKRLTGNTKLCEVGLPINEWSAVLSFFNHECAYCGTKEGLEQEHIIPTNDGGTYCIGNIVPSCRSCNASKGAKSVDEWYKKSKVFDENRLQKLNEYRCKTNINTLHKTNVSQADKEEDKEEDKKKNKEKKPKASEETLLMVASILGKYNYSLFEENVPELQKAVLSFIEFRKSIKKPMTEHAVDLLIKKLNEMTASIPEQIEIINQSIMNGWQGIFPLKEQTTQFVKQPKQSKGNIFLDMLGEEMVADL